MSISPSEARKMIGRCYTRLGTVWVPTFGLSGIRCTSHVCPTILPVSDGRTREPEGRPRHPAAATARVSQRLGRAPLRRPAHRAPRRWWAPSNRPPALL